MPRQVFTAGEILTAANMNDLSDSTVMVFADSAARGSAIPTPSEGMVTYLSDVNQVQAFNGSAFAPLGTILQVVSTTKTDAFSASISAGATSAVTGLSATITPSSASNKVYIFGHVVSGSGSTPDFQSAIVVGRGGSTLATATGDVAGSRRRIHASTRSGSAFYSNALPFNFLDSPATTSATTYNILLLNSRTSTQTYVVNRSSTDTDDGDNGRSVSTITLVEVAG